MELLMMVYRPRRALDPRDHVSMIFGWLMVILSIFILCWLIMYRIEWSIAYGVVAVMGLIFGYLMIRVSR